MKKNFKLLGVIVFLIALYAVLNKVIIPFTFDAAKSDLYLDGSDDSGSRYAVSSEMADFAFKHCNTYIKEEMDEDLTPLFASQAINVWDIGSYTYLVNGEVEFQDKNGVSTSKKYVCRIKYDEGDQNDFNNWSVYGISGLDDEI
ncbi:MAG: hypothetical protein ACU837_06835 [Gammaproteobacteria bacterium]